MATLSVQRFSPATGVLAVGDPISVRFVRNDQSADTIIVRLWYSGAFIFDATQYATLTDTTCVLTIPWSVLVSESGGWVRANVGFWFEMVAYETPPASYADYEWTRVVRVNTYDRPEVTILEPSTALRGYPLDIQWTINPGGMDGVLADQHLVILEDVDPGGGTVYSETLGAAVRSLTLGAEDVQLMGGSRYRILIDATNDVGLSASASGGFLAAWSPPPLPRATVTVDDETLGANVTVTQGPHHNLPQTLTVARIGADGSRWVIGTDLTSGAQVLDPLPPLGVEYAYEITSVDSNGAASVAYVSAAITTGRWAFNFGDRAEESLVLRFNPKTSHSITHDGAAYHFADGGTGGGLPVWYGTSDRDESGNGTWDTVGYETADAIADITRRHPVGWMRDPYGHRRMAHMVWSFSHGVPARNTVVVSLDWDKMRFREAW